MRISDWSSDVCSSDLPAHTRCRSDSCATASPDACAPFSAARLELPPTGRRKHSHHSMTTNRSEEHTSELQSLMRISYAVFCLKKKQKQIKVTTSVQIHIRKEQTSTSFTKTHHL